MTAKFKLTEPQMRKLANTHKNGTDVSLRLNRNMIGADGIPLASTASEYKIENGNTHDIKIGASRVKRGSFLLALVAALPAKASVIGGVRGLTRIASNIKSMVDNKRGGGCKKKLKGGGVSLNPN